MIIDQAELGSLRADSDAATVALRFGSYDLLHQGHQEGIDFAAAQADILVVGVMPDGYVEKKKGVGRPVNPEADRAAAIDEAVGVDYTFVAPGALLERSKIVRMLHPDVFVEHEQDKQSLLKRLYLEALGVEYKIDRQNRSCSTTEMIAILGLDEAALHSSLDFRC